MFSFIFRSSQQRCSMRKDVLRNFAKFTGEHLCQRLFLNKVAGLRPAILIKKRLWHRCFPVNFAKFLKTTSFDRTPSVTTSDYKRVSSMMEYIEFHTYFITYFVTMLSFWRFFYVFMGKERDQWHALC